MSISLGNVESDPGISIGRLPGTDQFIIYGAGSSEPAPAIVFTHIELSGLTAAAETRPEFAPGPEPETIRGAGLRVHADEQNVYLTALEQRDDNEGTVVQADAMAFASLWSVLPTLEPPEIPRGDLVTHYQD